MINTIIEALNERTNKGFYIVHSGISSTAIKSCIKVFCNIYFIENNSKTQVFTYTRVINRKDYGEDFKKSFDKEVMKSLTFWIIDRKYECISN